MQDPVVEEMRRNFEKMAARYDFDIKRIAEHLQEEEAKYPERVVYSVPRPVPHLVPGLVEQGRAPEELVPE